MPNKKNMLDIIGAFDYQIVCICKFLFYFKLYFTELMPS